MRFIVLLFGFLGCLVTAACSALFLFASTVQTEARANLDKEYFDQVQFIFNFVDKNAILTGVFLLIGAAYGLLGTLLSFFRCGWQGSLLMFVPLLGPAILNPVTVPGTGLQAFAALLSAFVRPLPISPAEDENNDD